MANSAEGSSHSNDSQPHSSHSDKHFDSRWLILVVIIAVVTTSTIMANHNHIASDISKFTNTVELDNGDTKIDWDRYPTANIKLSDTLTITESGTYNLSGTMEDGMVVVKAGDNGVVRLRLEDVSITNSAGPAIACYSADDLVIELSGTNTIEDSETYPTDFDSDVTGAIYSKADTTFQGDGKLVLTAHYQDGIVSKDDLKFNSGSYSIKAADDAIRGKDSVHVVSGRFTLDAGADAIKSTNTTDGNKGYIMIDDGDFNITASAKGIKAVKSVLIYGGSFILNTYDDAIHSDNYVGISDGNIRISTSDDAVHADRELIVDGGNITAVKAYEGLEAQAVTINNGAISLTTTDDGINAGGGADDSATSRVGAGPFDANEDCALVIGGGNIYINSAGDGVDSNGWLYINGGNLVIDGPTNNGNGALDAGMGIVMNGGEVIAIGASGMAESLGNSSSVYNASIYLSTTQPAGTVIAIQDSNGNTIIGHTSTKSFNHIAVGTSSFQLGDTYTIFIDGEAYQSFTISNITTTVGNSYQNQQMMPGNTPTGNPGATPNRH